MEQPFLKNPQLSLNFFRAIKLGGSSGGPSCSPSPERSSLMCPRGWQASRELCPVMRCNYPQVEPNWRLTSGPLRKFFARFCFPLENI